MADAPPPLLAGDQPVPNSLAQTCVCADE